MSLRPDTEKLRHCWADGVLPPVDQTRWFYERARGQYADEKARRGTPARQREFQRELLLAQKFTKSDLAKYLHANGQLPHLVSRGAQKNFVEFMLRLEDDEALQSPDILFFQEVVAKAILFKTTEKLVSRQRFGGYRANIVAYTFAYLSRFGSELVDLQSIWRSQGLPEPPQDCIIDAQS